MHTADNSTGVVQFLLNYMLLKASVLKPTEISIKKKMEVQILVRNVSSIKKNLSKQNSVRTQQIVVFSEVFGLSRFWQNAISFRYELPVLHVYLFKQVDNNNGINKSFHIHFRPKYSQD